MLEKSCDDLFITGKKTGYLEAILDVIEILKSKNIKEYDYICELYFYYKEK